MLHTISWQISKSDDLSGSSWSTLHVFSWLEVMGLVLTPSVAPGVGGEHRSTAEVHLQHARRLWHTNGESLF